jgi:hypothetical protein
MSNSCPSTSGSQLQHDDVFLELRDSAEHLTNQASRRVLSAAREIHTIRRQDTCANLRELSDDDLLDHQITCEAIGALDDDCPDAITLKTIKQRSEARSVGEFLCAGHSKVAELLEHGQAGRLSEASDCLSLPLRTVTVHLSFATHSNVANRFSSSHLRLLESNNSPELFDETSGAQAE